MNSAELLQRGVQIAIIGRAGKLRLPGLLNAIYDVNVMNKISLVSPLRLLPDNHPASGKEQSPSARTAYVCVGMTCSLPMTDADALTTYLKTTG